MQSLSVPLLPSTQPTAKPFVGGTRFVSTAELPHLHESLAHDGSLVVQVVCDERGKLGEKLEARIETELAARGASSPGMGADEDADALLSDQLFRARKLGHRGLCVSISGLDRLAAPVGGLDAVDARTLRFYANASRERPIVVLLRETDRELVAFVAPVSLVDLLGMAETAPPPAVQEVVRVEAEPQAPLAELADDEDDESTDAPAAEPPALEAHDEPESISLAEAVASPPPVTVDYRPWVAALHAARGPQPLGSFERTFAQSYMPLANAIAAGLRDPKALAAREEFARTFSRSYSDACPTFAVTGKRPRMVLDAHDLAKRLARTHNARSTHLLLVDAMRWDVGAMVRDALVAELTGRASLATETALFASLPTVTSRQLEGLTRGIDSLRLPHDADRDADPVRGRTAEVIRRVKVGSRDVYKLDAIESGLAKAQVHAVDALPELAQQAASAIARHVAGLAPRTLVFVFGDHGFVVDEEGLAHQGGAAPEEVIVPAFAFLTGELH